MSGGLAVWGILALRNPEDPWAYVVAWRVSYVYAAAGIIGLILVVAALGVERRGPVAQRCRSCGSKRASCSRAVSWPLAPSSFGWRRPPLGSAFLHHRPLHPPLIAFPLSMAVAIRRYRLWDIDFFINRTLGLRRALSPPGRGLRDRHPADRAAPGEPDRATLVARRCPLYAGYRSALPAAAPTGPAASSTAASTAGSTTRQTLIAFGATLRG
jgi:hypothetical protein